MPKPVQVKREGGLVTKDRHQMVLSPKVHLIIHTDSLEAAHVRTFANAAAQLAKAYKKHYPGKKHTVVVKEAYTGKEIVAIINAQKKGRVASLDIVSHGNQGGIHIAQPLATPVESGWLQRLVHVEMRAHHGRPQTAADAEFIEESMHGLYTDALALKLVSYYFNQTFGKKESGGKLVDNEDYAFMDAIDFSAFADDCYVEFHGCRVAEYLAGFTDMKENFAQTFSRRLPRGCLTVGHITGAKPDGHPNGNRDDYRQGKVRVYSGGRVGGKFNGVERWGLTFSNSSTPPKGDTLKR